MFDCIYGERCIRTQCDLACPLHAEITYWMERCNITLSNPVLRIDTEQLNKCKSMVQNNTDGVFTYRAKNTVATADLFTYCAICLHGIGTNMRNGIYQLNFSEYIDENRKTWSTRTESEKLEFMKIWSNTSKDLIISHLDYVSFGDYECQMLLTLIQSRRLPGKTTYIIIPSETELVGRNSSFYSTMINELKESEIRW